MPTTGWRHSTINQFIKNRYQQTWHTIEFSNNRHTRHHPNIPFRIAPEQLFKLTRFQRASQISVSAIFFTLKPAPPTSGTPRGEPFSGCLVRGLAAIFPLQRRRLRKQYPHTTPTANRPLGGSRTPKNPGISGLLGVPSGRFPMPGRVCCFYGVAHIWQGAKGGYPSTVRTTSKSACRGLSRYGSRTPGPQAAVPTPLMAWST
jgi:hypothetical protein